MPHTFFDEAAATWDDDPTKLARSRLIADAIARAVPLDGVRDALEYGCGTGQVTWALADRLDRVVLADASPGMLAVLGERLQARPEHDRARFEPRLLDLTRDSLPPASVDLIYTSLALHHVPDVPLVLRRFRAALRPGGHVAIADLDRDVHGHFHRHSHGDDFDGHHGFDRDALAADLAAAGFAPPAFETVTTLTKIVDDEEMEFPVFLAVAQAAGTV
nr:class I SAM-dependent methyltransferase [Propionibacterium sp.]